MHFKGAQLLSLFGLTAIANAHFVLQEPTSLGFDDGKEDQGPCGSFNPTDRSTGVTDYPVGGSSIGVLTTHTHVTWKISAALLSDTSTFVPISQDVDQTGVGSFCFGNVPGNSAWVGQDAVLQVIQIGVDGTLYQCAAIKFTAGGPGPVPNGCTNSTGVSASLIPGTGPTRGGSSSSTTSTPSSSTSTPSSPTTTPTNSSPSSSKASTTGASSSTGGSPTSSGGGTGSTTKASSVASVSSSASGASLSARSSSVAVASGSSTKASVGTISGTQTGTSTSPQFTGGSNSLNSGNIFLFGGAMAAWAALGM